MLSLLPAAPAQAQTTIWSATLSVHNLGQTVGHGCYNGSAVASPRCSNTAALSDDDFSHGGTDYAFVAIISDSYSLDVTFDKAIPQSLRTATLNVGSNAFILGSATFSNSDKTLSWSLSVDRLTLNAQLSVSLVLPATTTPTGLSIEATPACGATVTDLSVEPRTVRVGTPGDTQYRVLADTNGAWRDALPIAASGRSTTSHHGSLDALWRAYPGFTGLQFRLTNDTSVTATCTWRLAT